MENCWSENRLPWFHQYNMSRKGVVSICRMRGGHTSLNESLARFAIVPSSKCPNCDRPETVDHIFWECRRFDIERKDFIRQVISSLNTFPYPVKFLLTLMHDENIAMTMNQFINAIKCNI